MLRNESLITVPIELSTLILNRWYVEVKNLIVVSLIGFLGFVVLCLFHPSLSDLSRISLDHALTNQLFHTRIKACQLKTKSNLDVASLVPLVNSTLFLTMLETPYPTLAGAERTLKELS